MIGIDPKCIELAEHFLGPVAKRAIEELAEAFQQTADDFVDSQPEAADD